MHLPWRPQAACSRPIQTSPSLRHALTESQKQMYKLEKEENFRWIARLLALPSTRVLSHADLVAPDVQREIADLGQYAEVAHGSIDPSFVWRNLSQLVRPTFPLEGYDALEGSVLISVFHGEVAKLQGFIAHRPETRQLVLALSGTSSLVQTLHDVDARMVQYPIFGGNTGMAKVGCKVHAGFWRMFQGLKQTALVELANAFKSLDVGELVLTGHSLGAVQALLFVMELLQSDMQRPDARCVRLPPGLTIKVVGFGGPRVGNEALVMFYRKLVSDYQEEHGKDSFQEYLVKGYNDGVPCLPPRVIGFRHLTASSLYLFHGQLFHIPPSENEYSVFPVKLEDDALPPEYPLGGHNYYNNRDMEKSQRRIKCLDIIASGEAGWQERYMRFWAKESQKNV